jgi:hypothetical protein
MKNLALYLSIICFGLFVKTVQSQCDINASALRFNLENVKPIKIKTDLPANQDKSNLTMGTRICVIVNGVPTSAMVIGGGGPVWGISKDAYRTSIMSNRSEKFVKPNEIVSVGKCVEEYFPIPTNEIPANFDVRKLEWEIIKEVNIVRANPRAYADEMAKLKFAEFGKQNERAKVLVIGNDRMHFCTDTDKKCMNKYMDKLQVAIDYLRKISGPLSAVTENTCLAKASELLAADKGTINGSAHKDSRGRDPWERAQVVGCKDLVRGECLNANHITAAGFVVSFLTSPGHRDILMKTDVNLIGVDVHQHGTGKGAFFRDVIIMGQGAKTDDVDTDDDGLSDAEEAKKCTDPLKKDTDGDGVNDKEDAFPLDPTKSDSSKPTAPKDTDGDGKTDDIDTDDDNDGLSDIEEAQKGTDPLKKDTDGDGVNDKEDTFPLDPSKDKKIDEYKTELTSGESIESSKPSKLYSPDLSHYLTLEDNRVVIRKSKDDREVWRNKTELTKLDFVEGELIYTFNGKQVWSSETGGSPDSKLILGNDGTLRIFNNTDEIIWPNPCDARVAKEKYRAFVAPGAQILLDEKIVSQNGKYQVRFKSGYGRHPSWDLLIEEVINSDNCEYNLVKRIIGRYLAMPQSPPYSPVDRVVFNRDTVKPIDDDNGSRFILDVGKITGWTKARLTDDGRLIFLGINNEIIWDSNSLP